MPTTYTVRQIIEGDAHPAGHPLPVGHWGVYAPGYTLPAFVDVSQAECLGWVRRMGGSAVVEQYRTSVSDVATFLADSGVKADAPVGHCDYCGALAYVEVSHTTSGLLTFCLHHHRDNADKLAAAGYTVTRDARHLLTF